MTNGSRKKLLFLVVPQPPASLVIILFSYFFFELKNSFFFLVVRPLPPPPLSGPSTKKIFFCGFPYRKGIITLFEDTFKNYRKYHIAIILLRINSEYCSYFDKEIMDRMQMVKTPEARRRTRTKIIILLMMGKIM